MGGLGVLSFFILVAVFAPLIADEEALKATCPCNGVPFSPPSWEFPFGTDNFGRSVFALTVWGARVSLAVGLSTRRVQAHHGVIQERHLGALLSQVRRVTTHESCGCPCAPGTGAASREPVVRDRAGGVGLASAFTRSGCATVVPGAAAHERDQV
jgi:hypothetical protein